jgi:hypothetical protein
MDRSAEWAALIVGILLVAGNLVYCAIAIRDHFSQGRSGLAIFGLVAAAGSVLPLAWVLWVLFNFTT